MERVLSARLLTIGYPLSASRQKVVHRDLDFELYSGELTSLLGANGAGKSTLIKCLAGFIAPLGGEITLMGRPLSDYDRASLSRLVSVVLTERIVDANLSVRDVISLGRYPYTGFFGRLRDEDHRIVEQSAALTGVEDMLSMDIGSLSDGERQKVFIAKSLSQQTPLIILDEPTAFLDVKSRIEIMGLLHNLARSEGKSILISTHDMDVALKLSDRIWTLRKGAGILCGQTEDMVLGGAMSDLFDGGAVSFDINRATFVFDNPSSGSAICVEGCQPEVMWITSALERSGWSVVDSSAPCRVVVLEGGLYRIIRGESVSDVASVDELLSKIHN